MGVDCHNRCSLPSFYSRYCVLRDGTALLAWWQTLTTSLSPWALSTTGVLSAPGLVLRLPGWETVNGGRLRRELQCRKPSPRIVNLFEFMV